MRSLSSYGISLIAAFALAVSPARADYHYASHEGSDEYPYTSWETAADSIQKAIDAGSPGDTIYVGSGVWEDSTYILWDSLALIGMGMDSTTIYGRMSPGSWRSLLMNSQTLVEGFTFENCNKAIEILFKNGNTIRNNRFRNNNFAIMAVLTGEISNNIFEDNEHLIDCISAPCTVLLKNNTFVGTTAAGVRSYDGNWTIINNLFHHNPYLSVGSLLSVYVPGEADTAYIANNLFYRNLEDVYLDHTSTIAASYRVGVENNTIIGIEGTDYLNGILCISFEDGWVDLRNNTISQFKRAIHVYDWPTRSVVRLFYNNLWDNRFDCYPDDSLEFVIGNIRADPMFADTTSFQLQAYSPLIDTGDPEILDVDGTRSDIGVYGGPYGCSYVYLDLAPQIPDSITVEVEEDLVTLNWRFNTEADFSRYQIFRDTVSGFTPSEFNMIAEPDTSYYQDQDIDPGTAYYYRLTSVDNQGNVSDFSDEVAVIPTGIWSSAGDRLPGYTVIESAYPNPFNSNVTIVYSASNLGPQPPAIKLQIFDIQGRLVRTLVDDRMPMGTYRAVWDGTNDRGQPVSSGTYIARLTQWDCPGGDFPVKITLVK